MIAELLSHKITAVMVQPPCFLSVLSPLKKV